MDSHKKFKEKYKSPFILVSDTEGKIRELYRVKGFVIDVNGRIIHIYSPQLNPSSHVSEALKVMGLRE